MFRLIFRNLSGYGKNGMNLNGCKTDTNANKFSEKNVAYESEYYYKQKKELLKLVKKKLQEEVISMQDEIQNMKEKIDGYKCDINENMRFLKGLDKDALDASSTGKKGS